MSRSSPAPRWRYGWNCPEPSGSLSGVSRESHHRETAKMPMASAFFRFCLTATDSSLWGIKLPQNDHRPTQLENGGEFPMNRVTLAMAVGLAVISQVGPALAGKDLDAVRTR